MAGLWSRRGEVLLVLCALVTVGACGMENLWTPAGRRVPMREVHSKTLPTWGSLAYAIAYGKP